MTDRDTPIRLVNLWRRRLPDCYSRMELYRSARDNGDPAYWYPDYCDMPMTSAYSVMASIPGVTADIAGAVCAELTACYIWRKSKIVYQFDMDLELALRSQADYMDEDDVLPVDLLLHLPYPCVYVKTNANDGSDGFFCWIEYDVNRKAPELRIQVVDARMEATVPLVLHLIPGCSIQDCIRDTEEESRRQAAAQGVRLQDAPPDAQSYRGLLELLQLVLYLVSDHPDVSSIKTPTTRGRERREDRVKNVTVQSVGIRIGSALRKHYGTSQVKNSGSGQKKSPHIRRGHWHNYWVGSKDDKRLVLKWTHPCMIHADTADDPITVVPVKNKKMEEKS